MNQTEIQIARAKYPLDWQVSVDEEYAFMNLPNGVIYQFGNTPPIFIPGVHINLVEPYGDADEPARGLYWEKIPAEMFDPRVPPNEPQILVEEGEWAGPEYEVPEVEGDF